MKVYDAKNIKYRDGLAEKRRRVFILKILFFIGLAITAIGFLLYFLFFSGFFDIRKVSVNGLDKVSKDEFNERINNRLSSKWLGFVERQKDVVFFDSGDFKAEILTAFPEIKDISVSKRPPHALDISVTERKMAGIWCFNPSAGGCKYFDEEGKIWGEATRSSGFLILNVDDLRSNQVWSREIADKDLLNTIVFVTQNLKDLNILIDKFIIPNDYIGDFKITTSRNYALLFSMDSNIKEQLKVLKIFLAEKQKEPGFKPRYIDLRINGRVYFK